MQTIPRLGFEEGWKSNLINKMKTCGLMLSQECKARKGATRPETGFLGILDETPVLICSDCRALVRRSCTTR